LNGNEEGIKGNDLRGRKMKIIDFHVHIALKEHWHSWVHDQQRKMRSDYYERYDELCDPKRFASYLEDAGIEKAVILAELSPITTGIVPNEYVIEFCKDIDKFIPFASINPYLIARPARELEKLIDLGFKGLKLYPSYHLFYPNDREIYPLYEVANSRRIPVMIHTGSSVFRGARIKYADPIYIDDVAVDFPDLNILMVHSGRGFWYEKVFFLARLHENLYMEISGLPPQNLLKYFPDLETNSDKIIYGSDWPGVENIRKNIDRILELPIKEQTKEKILYLNAKKILGLQEVNCEDRALCK
jgi:predicted TIM-barrel fold metal-dependent hydrolase